MSAAVARGVRIKICGLTRREDLVACRGADLVGVVVGAPRSPRNLSWSEAEGILASARGRFLRVVVLVSPTPGEIAQAFRAGADRVQVHGAMPSGLPPGLEANLIPSLPLPGECSGHLPPALEKVWRGPFPLVHLDTAWDERPGGTGMTWDWGGWSRSLGRHRRDFLLAGGLTPENVARAMAELSPWGVDVSSGVEARPGEKDPGRIQAFIRAVRAGEGAHA
jgi:phosphoribosylanthranilate isomerase